MFDKIIFLHEWSVKFTIWKLVKARGESYKSSMKGYEGMSYGGDLIPNIHMGRCRYICGARIFWVHWMFVSLLSMKNAWLKLFFIVFSLFW